MSPSTNLKSVLHGINWIGSLCGRPCHLGEVYLEFFETLFLTFPWVSGRAKHESQDRFAQSGFDRVHPGQIVLPCM